MALIEAFDFSVEIHSYPWGHTSRRKYSDIKVRLPAFPRSLDRTSWPLFRGYLCLYIREISWYLSKFPSLNNVVQSEYMHTLIKALKRYVIWLFAVIWSWCGCKQMYRVRCEWQHCLYLPPQGRKCPSDSFVKERMWDHFLLILLTSKSNRPVLSLNRNQQEGCQQIFSIWLYNLIVKKNPKNQAFVCENEYSISTYYCCYLCTECTAWQTGVAQHRAEMKSQDKVVKLVKLQLACHSTTSSLCLLVDMFMLKWYWFTLLWT